MAKIKNVLQAAASQKRNLGVSGSAALCEGFLLKLGDSGDTYVDFLNFVPGGIVYDSGFRQPENVLEFSHASLSLRAIYAIRIYLWKCGVCLTDGI